MIVVASAQIIAELGYVAVPAIAVLVAASFVNKRVGDAGKSTGYHGICSLSYAPAPHSLTKRMRPPPPSSQHSQEADGPEKRGQRPA